ncbi:MAG: hypothetical protein R3335_14940 [Anaerolineales bacterium]|nr:hypothetical protein [Anaerolineales bacterium]
METTKIVALCLIVGLVVMMNILLFAGFKRGSILRGFFGDVDMYRKATQRARNPWADEDSNLQELSKLVQTLKGDEDHSAPDAPE